MRTLNKVQTFATASSPSIRILRRILRIPSIASSNRLPLRDSYFLSVSVSLCPSLSLSSPSPTVLESDLVARVYVCVYVDCKVK